MAPNKAVQLGPLVMIQIAISCQQLHQKYKVFTLFHSKCFEVLRGKTLFFPFLSPINHLMTSQIHLESLFAGHWHNWTKLPNCILSISNSWTSALMMLFITSVTKVWFSAKEELLTLQVHGAGGWDLGFQMSIFISLCWYFNSSKGSEDFFPSFSEE